MKNLSFNLISIGLLIFSANVFCQEFDYSFYSIDFEDSLQLKRVVIDSSVNKNCSWQIGQPRKITLSEANSFPNVIITDTIQSYPVNDSSVFTIKHVPQTGFIQHKAGILMGYYKVDSDTLLDFGKIEFSPDKGSQWIDILNDTLDSSFEWNSKKPILTGKSDWEYFWVNLATLELDFNDTIIFRFTFISDSIDNGRDGLMFDNLEFIDWFEGILSKNGSSFNTTVFPNPSNSQITIVFDNSMSQRFDLIILNEVGQIVDGKNDINGEKIDVNISKYVSGLYFYRLVNLDSHFVGNGKFIVN